MAKVGRDIEVLEARLEPGSRKPPLSALPIVRRVAKCEECAVDNGWTFHADAHGWLVVTCVRPDPGTQIRDIHAQPRVPSAGSRQM